MVDNEEVRQVEDEPPPFLGRWPRVYGFVLAWLAALVCIFYAFARAWSA